MDDKDKNEDKERGVVMDDEEEPAPKMTAKGCLRYNLLLILMVVGMVVGIALGIGLRLRHQDLFQSERNKMYLAFPGNLVLAMLQVLIGPLIVTTLIAGVANLPQKAQGRLGGFTVAYYLTTTLMAVFLGMLLVGTIKPGVSQKEDVFVQKKLDGNAADTILDIIRNVFPDNVVEAAFRTSKTDVKTEPINATGTYPNGTKFTFVSQRVIDEFEVVKVDRVNTLGLICFSIAFGLMISRMGDKGKSLADFFMSLSDAMLVLTTAIVHVVPIGIIFLVAARIVNTDDLAGDFQKLGMYMVTIMVGLAIHSCIILPLLLIVLGRRNPIKMFVHVSRALITAIGTASSSATMPVTLKCLRENAKVHPLVANFVIPVGATVNMDGTGLYEAVASIYMAQRLGMYLSPADYVVVSITATLAAIGAAGIPEAGLVTMLIVLQALGIPYDSIGFILAVDWFLDRFRTAVNVWGDSIGAGVVERMTKTYLKDFDIEDGEEGEQGSHTPPPNYEEEDSEDGDIESKPGRSGDPNVYVVEGAVSGSTRM